MTTETTFFVTPGYGETLRRDLHFNQAVRVGDVVLVSGQGGWHDDFTFPAELDDEIVRAFDNVERTLALAGTTWRNVIAVDSFHVPAAADAVEIGDDHTSVMVRELRARMGDNAPVWTEIGVAALGLVGMNVEIRVTAIIDPDAVEHGASHQRME